MKVPLLTALVMILCAGIFAETIIPAGPVSGSWNATGSPYRIMGDIAINDMQSLTIGPGVDVIFQGTYKLQVFGQIVCNGDLENNVTFTAQDTLMGWHSIRFQNSGGAGNQPSAFTYTNFNYGKALYGSGASDPLNSGGAVWADFAGTLTFNFCKFVRCMSAGDGSAVYASNQTNLVMNDCLFKDCEAEWFGGVYIEDGTGNFTNCSFLGNNSNVFGAAMYILECPVLNIVSCKFENNSAGAVAGIYCLYTPLVIKNSLFQGNYTVTGRGGAIGVTHGSCDIINCTFTGNSSPMDGGAVWFNILDEPGEVVNSIFWDNLPDAITNISTTYTLSYCSMQVPQGGDTNIYGNPMFTDPEQNNFVLQQGSPCIDAGTPDASGLGLPFTDLNGQPRIIDGNDDGVPRIDMGCYESPTATYTGEIMGQVTDSSGQPVAGAAVTAGEFSTVTDTWGLYGLTVPHGVYDVTCSKQGYEPVTHTGVTVTTGEMTLVNFVLIAVAVSDDTQTPPATSLRVFPNPFSAQADIVFSLEKDSHVLLEIFNLRGQKVRSLLNADLNKGEHAACWNGKTDDGSQTGKGMYLCRLQTREKTIFLRLARF